MNKIEMNKGVLQKNTDKTLMTSKGPTTVRPGAYQG